MLTELFSFNKCQGTALCFPSLASMYHPHSFSCIIFLIFKATYITSFTRGQIIRACACPASILPSTFLPAHLSAIKPSFFPFLSMHDFTYPVIYKLTHPLIHISTHPFLHPSVIRSSKNLSSDHPSIHPPRHYLAVHPASQPSAPSTSPFIPLHPYIHLLIPSFIYPSVVYSSKY